MVPFLDLKAQYVTIKEEIKTAVEKVLESCQFVLGDEVGAFEEEFGAYCGADHAVGVNSGTSALHLALLAAGIGPEDEVITTPFTFVATVAAICYTGARPVLVDIDPHFYTIAANKIEQAITRKTKAILPVHLYGQPADMASILDIARSRNLVVIEDAAQAHGSEYKGRRVGSLADLGCFSFYPGKNLGAYGEAGMVVTGNPAYARALRMLRDWGCERKNHHEVEGFNYRMEGIQGAILRVKLRHLEEWTAARRQRAAHYDRLLSKCGVGIPKVMSDVRHVYHVYAISSPRRDELLRDLHSRSIQTNIHYPIPVHLQRAYAGLGYVAGDFPHAEKAANEVISLPMYPELKESDQEYVCKCIESFYGE
ncbi:MAG: DegT/DnrJ/EryC1/StrS family aminotransferase [Syntrophobacteraceae bacterium]